METEAPTDEPPKVLQRNQNCLLTYVAPAFVIIGVLATIAFYYSSVRQREVAAAEQQRISWAKSRISFTGALPGEGCTISRDGERENCELKVTSTDHRKRILSFVVQFPSGYHEGKLGQFSGTVSGGWISVDDGMKYLVERASPFIRGTGPVNVKIPVPIVIYTTYEFEGQEYSDRALYHLIYAISPFEKPQAVPVQLFECGRLGPSVPEIHFLIDPWVESKVGYEGQPSTSLVFSCGTGYGYTISVDQGQVRVLTNLSPGESDAPQGAGKSYAISMSRFSLKSATNREIPFSHKLIEIGGPVLRGMPLPPG